MMGDIWVLRHGESTANVEGLIVSVPGPRALAEVGLTPRGREQARQAGRGALEQGLGADALVLSSDFARARQTAEEFASVLGAREPRLDPRLRERCFGNHDEGPASAYEQVWAVDRERGTHEDGVEAVQDVATRIAEVLREADTLVVGAPVVLVAHGDVLQITLAVGAGVDPHDHRDVSHLGNAELRRLGPGRTAVTAAAPGR
ncbi:histidine phosphatase family protein [Brachybacterium fresconis]|uniref:Broad specificity phosphatase PhoE n=1 Tax=Brachybacterium fresconis TaxID=173363 RepID=A0ABS4YJI4_9MICO|nr:histidine phosphatase family protein [Brachybacterium fresconis]MBP2408938.1 broad specificity phosphatase PhoE [Brachybacterium fresconis]